MRQDKTVVQSVWRLQAPCAVGLVWPPARTGARAGRTGWATPPGASAPPAGQGPPASSWPRAARQTCPAPMVGPASTPPASAPAVRVLSPSIPKSCVALCAARCLKGVVQCFFKLCPIKCKNVSVTRVMQTKPFPLKCNI